MQQSTKRHSLSVLELIQQYDTFLEGIKHVADMGCGAGEDIQWWATLTNNNPIPEPYNFNCFAVDKDASKLAQIPIRKNLHKVNEAFDKQYLFPVQIELMLAHDSLQYSTNPLHTLKMWNEYMKTNGMLILSVPQHTGIAYDQQYSRGYNGCYIHYNPIMLIYMLAVNGFDCRDAYLLKKFQEPWIDMVVYKSDVLPMNPDTTTWFDLIDKELLHPSMVNSLNANGYLKQEEIVMPWLDKELYFIDYVSQHMATPEPESVTGVINEQPTYVSETTIKQGKPVVVKSIPPTRKSYK
jgi:SAM-dependent methyltransferase